MRSLGIARYHLRRHWRKILLYSAAVFVISLFTLFVLSDTTTVTRVIADTEDGFVSTEGHTVMNVYSDPSQFLSPTAFSFFIAMSAAFLIWRERRFLVTLSLTRLQIIIGQYLYLIGLSVLLTGIYFVLPILGRGILWLRGFHVKTGWNISVLLTGGSPDCWLDLLSAFSGMVCVAGIWTLLGAIWTRWWKLLLVVGASFSLFLILLFSQIRWLSFLSSLQNQLAELLIWLFDVAIPAIMNYYESANENWFRTIALQLLTSLAATALAYPVCRSMKVVK